MAFSRVETGENWRQAGLIDGRESLDPHRQLLMWMDKIVVEGTTSHYRAGLLEGLLEKLDENG